MLSVSRRKVLRSIPSGASERSCAIRRSPIREIYYPAAQFHRRMFEHKLNEALKLMGLGAIEINVEHHSGWGREFSTLNNQT